MRKKQKICLLGASGSVGESTLRVIRQFASDFSLHNCSVHSNEKRAREIIEEFAPKTLVISEESLAGNLGNRYRDTDIYYGAKALEELVSDEAVDTVVTAIVGSTGIYATIRAIQCGKKIAIANKETLVTFGPYINQLLQNSTSKMVPVDSEHNALFQLMEGQNNIKTLYLTASGGSFRDLPLDKFTDITLQDALNHPTWNMGAKITIDSAGMINKGLEVIEAHFLFGIAYDKIEVVIHPQSIVHGIIELQDGSSLMYASHPDMMFPIAHSLFYPQPVEELLHTSKPANWKSLDFYTPQAERYPALALAYQAGRAGGNAPAIFNAANEEAVTGFMADKISFIDIPPLIDSALQNIASEKPEDLQGYLQADTLARKFVSRKIKEGL